MDVYKLIFRKDEPVSIRFQAFVNLFCAVYFITITLVVTHVAFFYILPMCYYDQAWIIFYQRLSIWYLFTNAIGQFVTCVRTDPGVDVGSGVPFSCKTMTTKTRRAMRQEFTQSINETTRVIPNSRLHNISLENMHFCRKCNLIVPNRTHHCSLCKKCITKRDHHCFFMGVCIGENNHVYFIFFTLYMGIGTFYGLLLLAKYMFFLYGVRFYGPQTFLTLFVRTMLSLLNGSIPSARYLLIFILLYISLFGTVFSFCFFFWHLLIVSKGQTTYEARMGISEYSKGSMRRNWKEVFSRRNFVSLFVPFWDLVTERNKQKRERNIEKREM